MGIGEMGENIKPTLKQVIEYHFKEPNIFGWRVCKFINNFRYHPKKGLQWRMVWKDKWCRATWKQFHTGMNYYRRNEEDKAKANDVSNFDWDWM